MNISHLTFHKKILTSHVLGAIILAQSLIIILLLVNSYNLRKTLGSESKSNGSASSQINQDVAICNRLQPEERPACAKVVGVKIAMLFSTSEEQILECMKMRPLMVRYCQEGLTSGVTP